MKTGEPGKARTGSIFGFNRNVFLLGIASFLTDVSSEMMFTIMPLFLTNVLGASTSVVGLVTGVGESTATLLRLTSGWLSDRVGSRKWLTTLGYSLSTVAKPFLLIAGAWGHVLAVRFADRAGKGIRSAPRDAMIADSVADHERGRNFGLHRAMDTMGAVVGLTGAAAIVFLFQRGGIDLSRETFQKLVLVGIVPAVLAVLVLIFLVKDVARRKQARQAGQAQAAAKAPVSFDRRFKIFLAIVLLFTLGNSSEAFLILRAQDLGSPLLSIFLMLALFNVVYSLMSVPAGVLSDKIGRRGIIVIGWAIFAATYLGFALATTQWQVWALFLFYGAYFGISEGVSRALVADFAHVERRGAAYGLYHAAVGITVLPASVIAGFLWQVVSPAAVFYYGAALAAAAAIAFVVLLRK
ncbi:MAG: MFS transporter [Dehalococcoidia bacterium]|nr:MFS transporter [Dehalococcoidia bacterium]